MSEIKVSILVPICNVERYLRECLDSLVNQTLEDIEIICINDGSTDSSLSIIREYERRDSRIVVIDKPNSGYGDSMNKGIELARGEYVGIVESDDFATIDMFEKLYKVAKRDELDIVRSNYYAHRTGYGRDLDILVENLAICGSYGKVFNPMDNPRVFMCQPAIWTSIYKKTLLDSQNVRFLPTPGASFQDTAFYFKAFYAANRVKLLKEGYLHYRVDNANSSVKNQNKLFCVCDEYAEVWNYAKLDAAKFQTLKTWIPRQQFEGYLWNLNRLSPELQDRFYPRYVEEFSKIREAGLIDADRFDERTLTRLNRMIDEPEKYYRGQYGPSSPARSVIACVNTLEVSKAKETLASLLECLADDDEVFVVAPASEGIVFELKNECECMGRLRNDADLIGQRLVGQVDKTALRSNNVAVVVIADEACSYEALASVCDGDAKMWSDGTSFAVQCKDVAGSKMGSLLGLATEALVDLDGAQVSSLPPNWGLLLSAEVADQQEEFGDSIACAKQLAEVLFDSSASYGIKKALYGQLKGVWARIRHSYSLLSWDIASRLYEDYVSMANVSALETPVAVDDTQSLQLSVVVPVYNVGDYLEECLASIAAQDYGDYEVILVNDGSTDNSLELLEAAANKDGRIRVVSQFNCGAGAARNRGIAMARGGRLIFIDPDDRYATNHVFSDLVSAMDRSGAKICGGSLALLKPSGKIKSNFDFGESFYRITSERDVSLKEIWTDYGWIRFMYSAELFEDGSVRFPQLNWYEDPVFFLSAVSKAGGCHVVPVDVYHYRVGYKEIDWTVPKARDMLVGMGINLKLADELDLGELYVTIVRRFNFDYREALQKNIVDSGVYEQLVAIQAGLNHELIRAYSSFDGPYYRLEPLSKSSSRRMFAIERIARRVAESRAYTGTQRLIDHLKGRR